MDNAKLIEPGARNYIYEALGICHTNRVKIYYIGLNIGVLVLFLIITGLVLYYCSKNKPTPYEKHQKMLRDQDYILSKIRFYQEEKKNLSTTFLENLNQSTI
jgi:hypothetical protein